MVSTALTNPQASVSLSEWEVMRQQAAMLVTTGFLPSAIKTPEQCVAIILTGRELGIPTMLALNTINVIQGKPSVSPQLMLALIYASKQADLIQVEEETERRCVVVMKRRGQPAHRETFTLEDAQKITTTEYENNQKKTISLAEKYNWRAMPKTMLKWRAIAACARVVFPDVILGLYTPEELGAQVEVDEEGQVTVSVAPVLPEPTQNQKARIHILAKEAGLDDAEYRALLRSDFGVSSSLDLSSAEAAGFIGTLQSLEPMPPEPPEPEPEPVPVPTDLLGEPTIDDPQHRKWRGWVQLSAAVRGDPDCAELEVPVLELPIREADLTEQFETLRGQARAAQAKAKAAQVAGR